MRKGVSTRAAALLLGNVLLRVKNRDRRDTISCGGSDAAGGEAPELSVVKTPNVSTRSVTNKAGGSREAVGVGVFETALRTRARRRDPVLPPGVTADEQSPLAAFTDSSTLRMLVLINDAPPPEEALIDAIDIEEIGTSIQHATPMRRSSPPSGATTKLMTDRPDTRMP